MLGLLVANFLGLVSVINPLGAVPLFLGLTKGKSKEELYSTALKSALIASIVLLSSFLIGKLILDFFSISVNALRISGGIIICISGFSMLLEKENNETSNIESSESDPSLTPLAMPMLAGPGSISFLISLNQEVSTLWGYIAGVLAILSSGLIVFFVLCSSRFIKQGLGQKGIYSLSKLVGFLIVAIGTQYILNGIVQFSKISITMSPQ